MYPALKRSVQIASRPLKEQTASHAGLGIFGFLLAVPGVLLAAAGLFVWHPLLLPAVVYGLFLSVVLSAARTVFTVALYRYAVTGQVPEGFSREVMTRRQVRPLF